MYMLMTMDSKGKNTRGLRAILPPKCKKRALKIQKRDPENCHRLQFVKAFSMLQI